ncbi:MAG TPA: cupredoxin family copper-binding protein [Gemmatimonadales bacterium]|nr:cupredoxin family copper-binding protein [Gemmatimonadales bacterium]
MPAVSAAQGGAPPPQTTTNPSEPVNPAPPAADPAPPSADPAPENGTTIGDQAGPKREPGTQKETTSQEEAPEQPSVTEQAEPTGGRGSGHRARASAAATVTMDDFFFSPASVSVAVGDLVTWRNAGNEPHNAVADDGSFDTGTVAAGQRASRMFSKPGTFSYICTIHPNMKGTVRVLSGGGGGGGTGGASSSSGPSEADAVASPNAAGDSNTLPMSGMAAGSLALVGLALVGSGLVLGYSSRKTAEVGAGR